MIKQYYTDYLTSDIHGVNMVEVGSSYGVIAVRISTGHWLRKGLQIVDIPTILNLVRPMAATQNIVQYKWRNLIVTLESLHDGCGWAGAYF